MKKIKHPVINLLISYIFEELKEDKEIKIGEHIYKCEKCLKEVRKIQNFKNLWDKFTLENLVILKKLKKSAKNSK